jgi:hypothetical protein
MVEDAIFARGVRSELVLNAMRSVPRESRQSCRTVIRPETLVRWHRTAFAAIGGVQ